MDTSWEITAKKDFGNIIKVYKCTFAMVIIGVLISILINVMDLDIFQNISSSFLIIRRLEIDELLIFLFLVLIGSFIDFRVKVSIYKQNILIKNNSYSVFKATTESLCDMMCNYIQSVQYYRSEMEGKSDLQIEKELDEATEILLNKIRDLELIEEIKENAAA